MDRKDASGNAVSSASWASASGWATSRFASASDATAAPPSGSTLFFEGATEFADLPSQGVWTLRFAGRSRSTPLARAANHSARLRLETGVGAYLDFESVYWNPTYLALKFAPFTYFYGRWDHVSGATFSVGSNVVVDLTHLIARVPDAVFYNRVEIFRPCDAETSTVAGDFRYDRLYFPYNYPDRNPIRVSPKTKLRCRALSYLTSAPEGLAVPWVATPFRVVLSGAASAKVGANLNAELYGDDFSIELENAERATLTLCGQKFSGNVVGASTLTGDAVVAESFSSGTLQLNANARLKIPEATTVRVDDFKTADGSTLDGSGTLKLAANGTWNDAGTLVDGVPTADYDARTNALQILVYDLHDATPSFRAENGTVVFTDPAFDANSSARFIERYAPNANGIGSYATIYDSSNPIVDATRDVYETTAIWDGAAKRTLVDATPNVGWNFYRVKTKEPIVKGFASLYFESSQTRRFAVWSGDDPAPPTTYYFVGDGDVSQANAADRSLSADGVAEFDGLPSFDGANVVLSASSDASAPIRFVDWGANGVVGTALIPFPRRVAIYENGNLKTDISQRLNQECKLVSFDVPTPSNARFFVGDGGTFGRWSAPDGATAFEVRSNETPSKRFAADAPQFLAANETTPRSWRVRVAAPIYGNVENWSEPFETASPLASFEENQTDSLLNLSFSIAYADDFQNAGTSTLKRRSVDSAPNDWTILASDFRGGDFSDAPPTSAEHVYRVEWNDAPDAVWLERKGARRDVPQLNCVTEITYASSKRLASETPLFAARIFRATTGELLRRDEVESIRYSLFETRRFEPNRTERLAVDSRGNYCCFDVCVSTGAFRDALLADARYWSQDDEGFNFAFTPSGPFFPGSGRYVVRATFEIVLAEERVEGKKRTFCVDFFADVN